MEDPVGYNSNSTLGGVGLTLSGDHVGLEWRWSWELSWSLTITETQSPTFTTIIRAGACSDALARPTASAGATALIL